MSENMIVDTESSTETTSPIPQKANFWQRLWKGIKEVVRNFVVGLKRSPQNIGLVVYTVALLVYTLNQTKVSNTTATIQYFPMGLCSFVALLFSILGFVCIFNSFPKRQKPKWVMVALFLVMTVCVIVCDVVYYLKVEEGILARLEKFTTATQIANFNKNFAYYYEVENMMIAHAILLGIAGLLVALSPVIGKLLRKIKTSVVVESNENMGAIETADE